jgi:uncharacterized ion transporter superfamily protein YfcC
MRFISLTHRVVVVVVVSKMCVTFTLFFFQKGGKEPHFTQKKSALSTHTYIYRDTKHEKVESGDRGAEEENGLFRRRWKRRA